MEEQKPEEPKFEEDEDEVEDEPSEEEPEPVDKIFCEWKNIKRTRTKFKCEFRNAIMHLRGRDYVVRSLVGELTY